MITAFVQENPYKLAADQLAIVQEWHYFVKNDFYVERYLKDHSIFVGNHNVYGVIGLTQNIEEIIPKQELPQMIHTVLLPFKGRIIYDGLFQSYSINFGSGIRSNLKAEFQKAKQHDAIITALGYSAEMQAQTIKPKSNYAKFNWRDDLDELNRIASKLKGGSGQPALNGSLFSLVKASIALASTAVINPEDADALYKAIKKADRALKQIKHAYNQMDDEHWL